MTRQPAIIHRKQSDADQEVLRKVSEILNSVTYGSITLIIQGGSVFQINKTESSLLDQEQTHAPRKGVL